MERKKDVEKLSKRWEYMLRTKFSNIKDDDNEVEELAGRILFTTSLQVVHETCKITEEIRKLFTFLWLDYKEIKIDFSPYVRILKRLLNQEALTLPILCINGKCIADGYKIIDWLELHQIGISEKELNECFANITYKGIVLYITSLNVIPKTNEKCQRAKKLLLDMRLKFKEIDITTSAYKFIIKNIIEVKINLPMLFIDGEYVGSGDMLFDMFEKGILENKLCKYII